MQTAIPQFETERLILREVLEKDIPSYKKNFIDYDVIRWLSSAIPWPYPENGVEDFFENTLLPNQGKDNWVWGIFLKEDSTELIGVVHLWREGRPENRGFWLAKKHWNKGIMSEAVKPVLNYAFSSLGFEKLIFANALGNVASRKVKEKTGCKLIEIREGSFVDKALKEQEIWELKKEDWK